MIGEKGIKKVSSEFVTLGGGGPKGAPVPASTTIAAQRSEDLKLENDDFDHSKATAEPNSSMGVFFEEKKRKGKVLRLGGYIAQCGEGQRFYVHCSVPLHNHSCWTCSILFCKGLRGIRGPLCLQDTLLLRNRGLDYGLV